MEKEEGKGGRVTAGWEEEMEEGVEMEMEGEMKNVMEMQEF